jgi:hemerythrin-like domain-containing protein
MKTEDAVRMWHDEHARFERLLDFLDAQMMAFHEGGHPNYELMRDIIYYLQHYADRYHHPREDVAFAMLLERDDSLAPVIKRLMHEHRVINTVGASLYKFIDDILADAFIARENVEAAAATYLVYYRYHIQSEEADVLPRAAQLLHAADWAKVSAAVPSAADPLFGRDVGTRYRDLHAQIMSENATAH